MDGELQQARVGIAGLGLMGGSLAMALRGRVAFVLGIDPQTQTRQAALRDGLVDEAVEALTSDAPQVDLLVLAMPVRAILQTLAILPALRPAGCAVLDLGSTKRAVVAAMGGLPGSFAAIGGHPMCGKETSGLASATADLYQGRLFILCPTPTSPAAEPLALRLIAAAGAHPLVLDAADHDARVAAVSHLPAVLAAALMRGAADERLWNVSASGFRDTARLAGSDPRMMLDILLTNRLPILEVLRAYQADLGAVTDALERNDETSLAEWLAAAQVAYAAYRRYRSAEGLLSGDMPDSGEIA